MDLGEKGEGLEKQDTRHRYAATFDGAQGPAERRGRKGEEDAKRDRLGNAVRETNAISRLSRLWRNFNGADDIHRFADVGNEIGLACRWHTNKRYAGRQAHGHGFIFIAECDATYSRATNIC